MGSNADLTVGLGKESLCSCTALRKASRRISQLYDVAFSPSGLSTNQRSILAEISRSPPMRVGKLAEALVMDQGALAHTLKPLVRDGLVESTIDPSDRRQRLISLTDAGMTRLIAAEELWASAQDCFETAFGKTESDILRSAMKMLVSPGFLETFQSALRSEQDQA